MRVGAGNVGKVHQRIAGLAMATLVLVALATTWPASAPPAAGQVAPPTVVASATDGAIETNSFCSDFLIPHSTAGQLTVSRTGDTSSDLTVHVSYVGDAADLPPTFFLAAGQASATVAYEAQHARTATMTIEPDGAYELGDPATATVSIQATDHRPTCRSNEQTIRVGERPVDIPVAEIEPAIVGTTMHVDGYGDSGRPDLGGLAFDADGHWTGTAGRVGDFSFLALWCTASNGPCALGEQVTLHVLPVDGPPPPAAPPASPRPGTSPFTG